MTTGQQLPPADLETWVLAGQSNMEGVGELAEALPPDPRVWSFASRGAWEIAQEPLHWCWESYTPINIELCRGWMPELQEGKTPEEMAAEARRTRTVGTGLGLPFAQAMADAVGVPIGLIPAAHGGTSMAQWSPALKDQGGHSLYGAMFDRIARAGRPIRGLLWYQGESDTWPDGARAYPELMRQWITQFRADIGIPDLPVLLVQLGNCTLDVSFSAEGWNAVRHAQYALADQYPNVAVTSAVDLGLDDVIHIDTEGLIRLGRRMARQALTLTGRATYALGPRLARVERLPIREGREAIRLHFTGVTGAWQPANPMGGFTLLDRDGAIHTINHIFSARRDAADPSVICLRLNLPMEEGDSLVYGHGLHPFCNVADSADMPLCAFRWTVTPHGGILDATVAPGT